MKKLLMALLYILFLAILVEFGVGQLGYRFTQGEWHSYEQAKQQRNEIIAANVAAEREAANIDINKSGGTKRRTEILHPYMGFVVDFHDEACPDIGFCDDRMRSYQPLLNGRDFPEAAPDRAIVAITGGSFAYGVANNSTKGKIEQALATIPELQGKQILVYTLALGGFKQPQQLFALEYYLAMGAHFDMIINIDGFNEMVLPQVENLPFRTNPFFPRVWHTRVRSGVENYQAKMIQGTKAFLGMERARLAESTNRDITRRSAVRGLIWKLQDTSLQKRIAGAEAEYLETARKNPAEKSRMIAAGTDFPRDDENWVLTQLAGFWRQSSVMMNTVAKAHNIRYYHFLQPNQYVDNSKPMSREERAAAFLEGSGKTHPYAKPARAGYPYLIAQGEALKQSGVAFQDLTMMFKDNSEILYRDACCHLTSRGYDYVIDEIVDYVKAGGATKQERQTRQ
ncbi:MAG: hypothetical protein F9K32_04165 [Desulfobulbaceae bacterium]|nr:MAG: hypothetical protein F9K32_04165 [Desulfobulbaceae bacterium]